MKPPERAGAAGRPLPAAPFPPGRASARSAAGSLFPPSYSAASAVTVLLFSATSLMNSVTRKAMKAKGAA